MNSGQLNDKCHYATWRPTNLRSYRQQRPMFMSDVKIEKKTIFFFIHPKYLMPLQIIYQFFTSSPIIFIYLNIYFQKMSE